jgi:hypothetical protein
MNRSTVRMIALFVIIFLLGALVLASLTPAVSGH